MNKLNISALIVVGIVLCTLALMPAAAATRGNTLVTDCDADRVFEVDSDGNIVWEVNQSTTPVFDGSPSTADRLPNGNTLVCEIGGTSEFNQVIEVDSAGSIVWEVNETSLGLDNCDWPDAHRLPNGNTLICAGGGNARLTGVYEVDNAGTIVWYANGDTTPELYYSISVGRASRLSNGNTLIACDMTETVMEVDIDKNCVWFVNATTTPGWLRRPFDAERLPNGNTLICDTDEWNDVYRVIEVDSAGNVVWEVNSTTTPGLCNPMDADRLPDGNTLIVDYNNWNEPRIIEVDRDGNILWELNETVVEGTGPWETWWWINEADRILPPLEFGDAPDPTYPSRLASNGARHIPTDTECLGLAVTGADWKDFEFNANIIDADPFEDGLLTSILITNNPAQTIDFEVSNLIPDDSSLIVNILLDLNADGDWSDTIGAQSEHVVQNQPIPLTGVADGTLTSLPFSTVGATPGPTWMRITLTRHQINPGWDGTIASAGYADPFECGETEDWLVERQKPPNATVYFEPEDIRLPGYCNTTTVSVWVNTTIAMGSGQLKFNYTYCCANVTEFESNSTNFDAVANPGSLCAAVLTPRQVKINFATTAPAGLGPGPVHIGNLTMHCCNETGYCMTDLTWLPGYPDSYVESAANGFIEPVKYEDGEFRCNIPDLVITGVYGLGNDTHYTVNYTVKNEGAANAAAGHYTNLTVDGVQKETKQVPDVLAPGEEREYSFDTVLARNMSNPYDMITVCADYNDTVVELSETNNCKAGRYPAEVVISVVPELTVVQPQEQFDVKIHVDPRGQFIYGVQYYLKYNTSVLRAETQVKGPFLGAISDTMVVINEIDQVNGIVEYAETRKVDGGVNVPNNVSTIHFIAIGERGATSTLDLFDVVIVDENKEETLYKTINGTVEINENQPPVPIAVSKHRTNNVAKKYQSTAILCSCSYDPDYPGKGGNVSYIRWAFGDGQYGTSEGLPVDNCTCKEHKYESWLWNYTSNDYDNFSALLTVTDDGCPELSKSSEFDVTVFIAGDADGDGEVNIIDAVWVGKHWRDECATTVPCANCTVYLWDGAQVDGADLNNDCEINILDAVVIGANWRHVAW